MTNSPEPIRKPQPKLRRPEAEDGAAIWELIQACKPLDENSMYCNLIQCDHFADTCVVAELNGEIVGWVSGYLLPQDPETLFVWQVAVSPRARGLGLGKKMLMHLLGRDACADAAELRTTITEDNEASWALFRSVARTAGGEIEDEPHFEEDTHFEGQQDTEHLVTITLPGEITLERVA